MRSLQAQLAQEVDLPDLGPLEAETAGLERLVVGLEQVQVRSRGRLFLLRSPGRDRGAGAASGGGGAGAGAHTWDLDAHAP